jgi:O-antigen/teichoic acid export membrane protein
MSSFSNVTVRQLVGSIGTLISGMAVARIMSAVVIILIARQVGPGTFGQYAASFAVAKLSSVLFTLGVDVWLLRNGNRAGDPAVLARYASSCLSVKVVLGVLWLGGISLVGPTLNQDVFPFTILMLASVSVWLDEQGNTIRNAFKTAMQNRIASFLIVAAQGMSLGITILLLLRGTDVLLPFVIGQVIATALGTGLAYAQFQRSIGIHMDSRKTLTILREALPFALSVALALIYGRADITIIGHWLGEAAVGYYSPAVALVGALVLVPEASHTAMLPILSQLHNRDQDRLVQLSRWFLLASIVGGGIAAVGVIVVAHPLVDFVYGSQFLPSAQVLTILSGVLAARFVSFALAAIIVAVGWQKHRVIVQAVSAVLNVGLNLMIIQRGIIAVAQVYIVSEVVLMLGYLLLVILWRQAEIGEANAFWAWPNRKVR